LREFFDQWVYGAGFPEYAVTYIWDDTQKVATVKVSQTQKLEEKTGLFSMPIVFSFTFADGSSKDFTMQVNEKDNSFHLVLPSKPVMFRFDPDNWVLKTVDLKVPKQMLLHQLANDPSVMGRVYAAHALSKLGGADVVEALGKALHDKFFWGVSVEAAKCLATVNGAQAGALLKAAASHGHAYVRRAVVVALGSFKDESVAAVLAPIVSGEAGEDSVFVRADAAVSLGKTGSALAFDALKSALAVDSWQQTVRVGALNGLAELGDERAVQLAADFAGEDAVFESRPAAFSALGRLGVKHAAAMDCLHRIAETEDAAQFTLRMAVVGALGEAKKKESVPVLNRLKGTAYDGRVKRIISETIDSIQTPGDAQAETDGLKKQVEKLTTQVRDLTDRLDASAAAQAGGEAA
jgi:aminopeptidase N